MAKFNHTARIIDRRGGTLTTTGYGVTAEEAKLNAQLRAADYAAELNEREADERFTAVFDRLNPQEALTLLRRHQSRGCWGSRMEDHEVKWVGLHTALVKEPGYSSYCMGSHNWSPVRLALYSLLTGKTLLSKVAEGRITKAKLVDAIEQVTEKDANHRAEREARIAQDRRADEHRERLYEAEDALRKAQDTLLSQALKGLCVQSAAAAYQKAHEAYQHVKTAGKAA